MTSRTQETLLDPKTIANLRLLEAESPGLLVDLEAIFRAQAPIYVAAIRDGLLSGDPRAVRAAAHALKGTSANLGAVAVVKLAEELERSTDAAESEGRLVRLSAEIERAADAFRTLCGI